MVVVCDKLGGTEAWEGDEQGAGRVAYAPTGTVPRAQLPASDRPYDNGHRRSYCEWPSSSYAVSASGAYHIPICLCSVRVDCRRHVDCSEPADGDRKHVKAACALLIRLQAYRRVGR